MEGKFKPTFHIGALSVDEHRRMASAPGVKPTKLTPNEFAAITVFRDGRRLPVGLAKRRYIAAHAQAGRRVSGMSFEAVFGKLRRKFQGIFNGTREIGARYYEVRDFRPSDNDE